ncbi:hypothetical protein MMC07_007703 [Pseudocyphellaria aurata]|nr:hypothetical protein [Pseudocyphellaria aurata]
MGDQSDDESNQNYQTLVDRSGLAILALVLTDNDVPFGSCMVERISNREFGQLRDWQNQSESLDQLRGAISKLDEEVGSHLAAAAAHLTAAARHETHWVN